MYQKLQPTAAVAVTASDSVVITKPTGVESRGCLIYVGVSGDLAVTTAGGDNIVFKDVPQGSILPVQVIKVLATGTTATDLISLH